MNLSTSRLNIIDLVTTHAAFILELLNSPDWLHNIGDKGVQTLEEAASFIQVLNEDPQRNYWPVILKENQMPIGVVSLIKRSHLSAPDLGFALLPQYYRKGYAYEAASNLIHYLFGERIVGDELLGIALRENVSSITLLKKLGFKEIKERVENGEVLVELNLKSPI